MKTNFWPQVKRDFLDMITAQSIKRQKNVEPQTRRKYLYEIFMIKDLYPEYLAKF